ncbi:MAG: ComEC/Rec2 family competence protein [Terracidiphilus sp.]
MQTDSSIFEQAISGESQRLVTEQTSVPLFAAAVLYAVGITAAQAFALYLRPSLMLVALVPLAVLCGLAALRAQRIAWLPLALLWMLLGAWCAQMEPHPAPASPLAQLSDGLVRSVEGTVVDAGPVRAETEQDLDAPNAEERPAQRVDLSVSSLEVVTDAEDAQKPATGGVRLTVQWPQSQAGQAFRCGERIRAELRLLRPEVYHDPGVWSRQDSLLDQGITSTATVRIDRVERFGQAAPSLLCRVSALQHATSSRLLALPASMRRLPAPLRLSENDAIMLAAMITGDRTYLTHSLRVGFERTGSFHMLVVSGFHLAIVAGCFFWLTKRLRLPRVPATLVTILASFCYALFTGFATPVQRSLWMVTLYLIGRLFYRERNPLNTIGFAALCLLAYSPRSLFDSSFQMTLLAVVVIGGVAAPLLQATVHPYLTATRDLGLIALDIKLASRLAQFRVILRMMAAALRKAISGRAQTKYKSSAGQPEAQLALFHETWRDSLAQRLSDLGARFAAFVAWRCFPASIRWLLRAYELLVVSCIVELAMALPMALYFHRITVFALPVNIFILPLLAVLVPAALLTLLALVLWPPAAILPAMLAAFFLHIGIGLVRFFGSLTLGDFRIPAPLIWQSLVFCALLGTAILLAHPSRKDKYAAREGHPLLDDGDRWRRRAAWATLLLAALVAVLPRPIDHPRNALLMEAIDVGQGDSLLLITPDGKTLLVDGGGHGGGPHQAPQDYDIGEEVVSEVLWSRGIRHLDAVALTHAHSDHMGGLPAVLRNFHPAELWVGNNPRFGDYNALLNEAASLHVKVRSLHAGDAFSFGPAQVNVLAPFRNYQPGPLPTNNDSMVMRVAYGATSVMLEGDAEAPVEEAMLAEPNLASTLLKVGHHGSITSTRPEFLARVHPEWAVISCGLRNRYGHPRPEVLEELQAAHIRTFSTDINGATCFRLDGKATAPDYGCGWRNVP